MKRIVGLALFMFSILSACNLSSSNDSSTFNFHEIENVPHNVQENIDSNLKLQLMDEGEKGSYIVFQSSGEVETNVETMDDTVTIKFSTSDSQGDTVEQHVYYLTRDPGQEVIHVLVDEEPAVFDEVVGL
ncbi:hypothetical protein LCL96_02055 [Rossellomorea aquimaris]|uniref:hypothetical protein n=1 Tax=Rossellomorea aquimaris TaxID=189382 RepID=UPI001CD2C281|nr:hypothetical protein [Rossellomorea aquimaris]MCA1057696.1 hypothetical protein [Rossellomorea aquimaris]